VKDYYKILGVAENSTTDEIKSAFRAKAKQFHPDVNKAPDAHERFIEIGEAYEVLLDPTARMEYDRLRNGQKSSTSYNHDYNEFKSRQNKAYEKAKYYSEISLEEILSSIVRFTYEMGRAVVVGERDKPKVNFGDYIKLGFGGLLITICIILCFTGVGAIPGIAIARAVVQGMKKDGKLIGIGPLFISTVVADLLVVFILYRLIESAFY